MSYDLKSIPTEFDYWRCECQMSRDKLFHFTYAVIQHHGSITSTFAVGCYGLTQKQNCRHLCEFIVKLPKGAKDSFEEMSGVELHHPVTVHVN